jgi:hypothetical protein
MFSACEYGIAIVNILFHFTAVVEFRDISWTCSGQLVGSPSAPLIASPSDAADDLTLVGSPMKNGGKSHVNKTKSS